MANLFDFRGAIIGTAFIDVAAEEHTSLVRRIRIPEEGLLDETITCVTVSLLNISDSIILNKKWKERDFVLSTFNSKTIHVFLNVTCYC